jgi:hypothetical protein
MRCNLGTSPECWDLHAKLAKARRRAESAEYKFYERGQWPKNKSRQEWTEHVAKVRARAAAIENDLIRRGC